MPMTTAAETTASAEVTLPDANPLGPHRRQRDVLVHQEVGRRGLGHRSIPAGDLLQVPGPPVHGSREDQARANHDEADSDRRHAARDQQPGHQHQRVRLDERPKADQHAGQQGLPALNRHERTDERDAQEGVGLPEGQLAHVELADEEDGEPDQPRARSAAIRERVDRPSNEHDQQADRTGVPHDLGERPVQAREWRHRQRERREVLELEVTVIGTVERFGGNRPCARPSGTRRSPPCHAGS